MELEFLSFLGKWDRIDVLLDLNEVREKCSKSVDFLDGKCSYSHQFSLNR